jgi:hypothetical protein
VRSRLVRDDDIVVRANVPWSPDDEPADPGGLLAAVTAAVPGP